MIKEEVSKCEQAAKEGKFRLGDLLAVPMQRILKYHLLLRELLQNTVQSHEEYYSIQQEQNPYPISADVIWIFLLICLNQHLCLLFTE